MVHGYRNNANGPVDLILVPLGLLARRLRSRLGCQKQASIGDRGQLENKMRPHLLSLFLLSSTFCLLGQDRPSYFFIDAPGPAYREFYKGI
jgi:hypothetical protein